MSDEDPDYVRRTVAHQEHQQALRTPEDDEADYLRDNAPLDAVSATNEAQSACDACAGLGQIRLTADDGKRRASDGWRKCLDCNGTGRVLDAAPDDDDEHTMACAYYTSFAADAEGMCDCGVRQRREAAAGGTS